MNRFERSWSRQDAVVRSKSSRRAGGSAFSGRASSPESSVQREWRATVALPPLSATVISAVALTHGELDDLLHRLQQRYKREIRADVRVKPGFIGGVRVEIGNDVWTTSLRAEIDEMERTRVVHADEGAGANARVFAHKETGSAAHRTPADTQDGARRSMQLGKAIVAPPIPALERYEFLQSSMWARYPGTSMKMLLLVGAESGCGVSTAAASLAASLAQNTHARVLLIDANVRSAKPGVPVREHRERDSTDVSLRRLLTEEPALRDPAPGPSNLYVLPSGLPCSFSLSVFQSRQFEELLQKARELFEYVVIDGPSVLEHPETLLLSRRADGVILVVESERTRKQSALWAKEQIELAGGTLLGVILNRRKYRVPNWLYKRI